uniref:EGF-like domain-containing protein n=1 Tax=Vitrella brassicaformis TaxID=1169539 RepID=A0A7S1PAM8_9ALVE|mmetsp:Transcript_47741/g.119411  ORF Transcript_47741/g.119411 Transcript_47741/m.119411 type:complete len:444 (+) Transcript_47741:284-1615(+)
MVISIHPSGFLLVAALCLVSTLLHDGAHGARFNVSRAHKHHQLHQRRRRIHQAPVPPPSPSASLPSPLPPAAFIAASDDRRNGTEYVIAQPVAKYEEDDSSGGFEGVSGEDRLAVSLPVVGREMGERSLEALLRFASGGEHRRLLEGEGGGVGVPEFCQAPRCKTCVETMEVIDIAGVAGLEHLKDTRGKLRYCDECGTDPPFYGHYCCPPGTHGNLRETLGVCVECSDGCTDYGCDPDTGGCRCRPGWQGFRCDQFILPANMGKKPCPFTEHHTVPPDPFPSGHHFGLGPKPPTTTTMPLPPHTQAPVRHRHVKIRLLEPATTTHECPSVETLPPLPDELKHILNRTQLQRLHAVRQVEHAQSNLRHLQEVDRKSREIRERSERMLHEATRRLHELNKTQHGRHLVAHMQHKEGPPPPIPVAADVGRGGNGPPCRRGIRNRE